MRAGPLDRQVVIQCRSLSQNSEGAPVESWTTFATVWAQKTDLRGQEYFAAQKENAEVTTLWRIRYLTGLKAEMRISYDNLVYDIIQISELGRRDGMEIMSIARIE